MNTKSMSWIVTLLLLVGCTSVRITHSWKAENVKPKKFEKILVLGLLRTQDMSMREKMEDHLVGDLKDLGYNAVGSLTVFGPKAFNNIDEKTALNQLQNSGIDAVITIVLLDKAKERYYVPGHVYYSPYVIYHRSFWGYYTTMYDRIYSPGYYAENTKYFWESNLYDLSSKELIYSVQTESFNPASWQDMAHQYGLRIVNDMAKNKVLFQSENMTLQ